MYAGRLINDQLIYSNFSLLRNPNYPPNKTQEQFGTWVNVQNQAIFMPIRFFVKDIGKRVIASEMIQDFDDGVPLFLDMKTQFDIHRICQFGKDRRCESTKFLPFVTVL